MFYDKDIVIPFDMETSMCNVQNACLMNPDSSEGAIDTLRKMLITF